MEDRRNFGILLSQRWHDDKFLCVGLDSNYARLPECEKKGRSVEDAVFAFNRGIINATQDIVGAYKPNFAFYASSGAKGILGLLRTINYIRECCSHIPVILDEKVGDVKDTNEQYAASVFDFFGADAITVNPYLGQEPLSPFLGKPEKGVFVLCRTSNPGAKEIQDLQVAYDINTAQKVNPAGMALKSIGGYPGTVPLYLYVAFRASCEWNANKNCGLVVGATYPEELSRIRSIVGDMTILIPGIGKQGGDLQRAVQNGMDSCKQGFLINASSSVVFASKEKDYANAARAEALKLHDEINQYRR